MPASKYSTTERMKTINHAIGSTLSRPTGPAAGPRAQLARPRLIFGIVAIGLVMVSIDQTIVATALLAIQRELHAQVNWSGWTITIYSLGQVLVMPLAGKMSDQYGRKRLLLGAVALFTIGSLCCGLAANIYELVALRAVQAIGGGGIIPSASGIISDHFGKNRDRALGLFTSIFPIGAVIGPILGGVFVAAWSWRGIFLVNVPIGIVLFVLAMRFVPSSAPRATTRIDIKGVLLLGSAVLAAMLGISYMGTGKTGLDSPVFLVDEILAITLGWLFIRHIMRCPAPFIPARFVLGRSFGVVNVINFMFGVAAVGLTALVPLYAEQRYSLNPLAAGTLLTARGVGTICLAALAAMAIRRTGYRKPMIGGFMLMAGGLLMLSAAPPVLSAYGWLALGAGVTGLGIGIAQPASNNASLQLAPDDVATITGLRVMFRQGGSIIAISITTAILAQSSDPGIAQSRIFVAFAVILLLTIPMILRIPEHRGGW
jgi:EmrB/QacA subfamily drug resistance transporter